MALVEEPILSRLDRIDFMVRKLEEMKGSSPRSSSPSTPSSGTRPSSLDLSSPRSTGKLQSRSMEQVMEETERKGTLLERLNNVEEQVLKLCSQFEEEVEEERKKEENSTDKNKKTKKKKGLRKLVDKVVGSSSPTNIHSKSWRC
ncbi:uncharacterized protein LOC18994074 [Eutrema salsugineum]|uniref:uncharacterized protein LOC18994074 n=1 Tax=Eutrema salsugineum TaxID=72664 RepID=UPI000CED3633|nr:uncharacterized protein LOC18994074 [Eutrema salsugineum]